jgi:predicted Zn finger-like uncharacterized protein
VIVSCPSCGTHYRHQARALPVHARCGRCDTAFDRTGLRPYRIVPDASGAPDPRVGARRVAVGRIEPALDTRIAAHEPPWGWRDRASDPTPLTDTWDETEALPPIPEMAHAPAFEPSVPPVSEDDILEERTDEGADAAAPVPVRRSNPAGVGAVAAWTTFGSVLGTGVSWSLGNTTITGVLFGGLVGLTAAWGWLRWTSRP